MSDMSDRGGDSFELLSGQSWGGIDASDAAFFQHFLGDDWQCVVSQCLPVTVPAVPEPATWLAMLSGLCAVVVLWLWGRR